MPRLPAGCTGSPNASSPGISRRADQSGRRARGSGSNGLISIRQTARQIEQLAELDDLRTTLRAEVSELSPAHREALRLRIVEELPYPEVARRLAISEAAARARVSRALRALAEPLQHLDRNRHRLAEETLT